MKNSGKIRFCLQIVILANLRNSYNETLFIDKSQIRNCENYVLND